MAVETTPRSRLSENIKHPLCVCTEMDKCMYMCIVCMLLYTDFNNYLGVIKCFLGKLPELLAPASQM